MRAIVSARWFFLQLSYMHRFSSASWQRFALSCSGAKLRATTLAVAATFAAGPAAALSLGNPDVLSFLGQPLQMRVPVVLDEPGDAAAQCLRIINQPGGDVPNLTGGRIEVERRSNGSFLRLTTTQP